MESQVSLPVGALVPCAGTTYCRNLTDIELVESVAQPVPLNANAGEYWTGVPADAEVVLVVRTPSAGVVPRAS